MHAQAGNWTTRNDVWMVYNESSGDNGIPAGSPGAAAYNGCVAPLLLRELNALVLYIAIWLGGYVVGVLLGLDRNRTSCKEGTVGCVLLEDQPLTWPVLDSVSIPLNRC
jgi:hypothetical protein